MSGAQKQSMARTKYWVALVLVAAMLLAPLSNTTPAKTKKPLKESDARQAIASMPGFNLNKGAVKVREIASGDAPGSVLVTAEVETAIRFKKVVAENKGGRADAKSEQDEWRAIEFRSGDRNWEEFELLAVALGVEKIEGARGLLADMAAEFAAKELERQRLKDAARSAGDNHEAAPPPEPLSKAEKKRRDKAAKEEAKRQAEAKAQGKAEREVKRGAIRLKEFSPLLSSAVAICFIEATFRLVKGDGGKWRVVEFTIDNTPSGNLEQLVAAVNNGKTARARAELEIIRAALEAFRRERGFYVVADDSTILIDHLSPHYLTRIIRIDPWHRPYRYEGTIERYILRSDGADGINGTADDVTLGS